jgi:DNA-binding LacI/PurR family transcriptional regulator
MLASGLVTKQTKTLGLVIPDISSSYNAELCKGVTLECRKHGYLLFMLDTDNDRMSTLLTSTACQQGCGRYYHRSFRRPGGL